MLRLIRLGFGPKCLHLTEIDVNEKETHALKYTINEKKNYNIFKFTVK